MPLGDEAVLNILCTVHFLLIIWHYSQTGTEFSLVAICYKRCLVSIVFRNHYILVLYPHCDTYNPKFVFEPL